MNDSVSMSSSSPWAAEERGMSTSKALGAHGALGGAAEEEDGSGRWTRKKGALRQERIRGGWRRVVGVCSPDEPRGRVSVYHFERLASYAIVVLKE